MTTQNQRLYENMWTYLIINFTFKFFLNIDDSKFSNKFLFDELTKNFIAQSSRWRKA